MLALLGLFVLSVRPRHRGNVAFAVFCVAGSRGWRCRSRGRSDARSGPSSRAARWSRCSSSSPRPPASPWRSPVPHASRKAEAYLAALRLARSAGTLTLENERHLAVLQEHLGVSPTQALALREQVEGEGRGSLRRGTVAPRRRPKGGDR